MNILFLTLLNIDNISERGIYTDLIRKFREEGHNIFIVSPTERRKGKRTSYRILSHVHLLQVKTLNIQKTNLLEKGLGTIFLEYQYLYYINKIYSLIKFDLILYSTPPITFGSIISFIKRRDKAKSYLLLKDIFPQNAVDLGMIKKNGFIHRYFLKKERELYAISDYIGCMSRANVKYILKYNPLLDPKKVEINPNTMYPINNIISQVQKQEVRKKYGVPIDSVIFIYGGNLGKPQGIDFLIDILSENIDDTSMFFLIIGSGTEFQKLSDWITIWKPGNAMLLKSIKKEDYDSLIQACDVGLIFLDKRFTIPNFPSRILSYMENKIPILAATDLATDVKEVILNHKLGYWCQSGNLIEFNKYLRSLTENENDRHEFGENAFNYFISNYTVDKSYNQIIQHFNNVQNHIKENL